MKRIFGSIATLFVIALCACSSSSSNGSSPSGTTDGGNDTVDAGTCSAVASGGTTETLPCGLGANLLGGTTEIGIASPDQTIGVSVLINFNGAPTATTYTAANVVSEQGDFKSADKTSEWQEEVGVGDTQGTFSLTITDVGPPTDLGSGAGTGYRQMHGTFTGTFVQVSTDGRGEEVDGGAGATLNVTF